MGVFDVVNTVTVVIVVEVVLDAIVIEVTRPLELVNSCVIVIIFVVSPWSRTIGVFIGNTVVVVIHWILICKVERADSLSSPRVDDVLIEAAVSRNIAWVQAKGFECINVNWTFENSVVVVVPVICVENSVVVVIEWVGAVATVKSLEEVVNSIVVVVKIGKVVDPIVVVVIFARFFKQTGIHWRKGFDGAQVGDDSRHHTRVGPHQISD